MRLINIFHRSRSNKQELWWFTMLLTLSKFTRVHCSNHEGLISRTNTVQENQNEWELEYPGKRNGNVATKSVRGEKKEVVEERNTKRNYENKYERNENNGVNPNSEGKDDHKEKFRNGKHTEFLQFKGSGKDRVEREAQATPFEMFTFDNSGVTSSSCQKENKFCVGGMPCCDGLKCRFNFCQQVSGNGVLTTPPLPPVPPIIDSPTNIIPSAPSTVSIPAYPTDINIVPPNTPIDSSTNSIPSAPSTVSIPAYPTDINIVQSSSAPSEFILPRDIQNHMPDKSCRPLNPEEVMYWCPTVRYCPWEFYSSEIQNYLATYLTYTQFEWDYLLHSDIDSTSFTEHPFLVRRGLRGLGYDADKHDCCQTHFAGYGWSDFVDNEGYEETLNALTMLGYNQTSWDQGLSVPADEKMWADLTLTEQWAVYDGLCYTEELWNQYPIAMWTENATMPSSYLIAVMNGEAKYYYEE